MNTSNCINTGILEFGGTGTPLKIYGEIDVLCITIDDNATEQTAVKKTNITPIVWKIILRHPFFLKNVTPNFINMKCKKILFNYSNVIIDPDYQTNIFEHLPISLQEIIILNDECNYIYSLERFRSIKSLTLFYCKTRWTYNMVSRTKIDEVTLIGCEKQLDEHLYSNSRINYKITDADKNLNKQSQPINKKTNCYGINLK